MATSEFAVRLDSVLNLYGDTGRIEASNWVESVCEVWCGPISMPQGGKEANKISLMGVFANFGTVSELEREDNSIKHAVHEQIQCLRIG